MKKLKITLLKEIKIHKNAVISICFTKDGRLASASKDKTIKVFNLETYECEITIKDHLEPITYISQISDGNIASSTFGFTINIWKIEKKNYTLVTSLTEHEGTIWMIKQLSNNRLGSCSNDETIKIWTSSSPYHCIKTITGHICSVFCIIELRNRRHIVSCSGYNDETIRFWNNTTYQCEKIIEEGALNLQETSNLKLIATNVKKEILVINLVTFQLETKILNDESYICSYFELNDRAFLFGCGVENYGSINVFDINICKIVSRNPYIHKGIIHCILKLKDLVFISASEDCYIKFWQLESDSNSG